MIKEQFDLSGKTALVMGGRGFLGRRFCAALAEFGAKVYSADLPDLSLAAASDHTMTSIDTKIDQFDCDVTDPASVKQLIEKISSSRSRIDALIYSVTAKPRDFYKPFTECSLEGWQKQLYAHPVYAAAKGAVISLTRFLAAYWGDYNIRVNCISPGGLAHPGENEQFVQRYSARVPLRRKGGLDEISGAVVYLSSDASSYVTGHNLVVDGGWTAW